MRRLRAFTLMMQLRRIWISNALAIGRVRPPADKGLRVPPRVLADEIKGGPDSPLSDVILLCGSAASELGARSRASLNRRSNFLAT
jgi:hypothetical protein